MDVVYVLRAGENPELRYSLRSLKHLPHGRVWAFGGPPPKWLRNVEVVGVQRSRRGRWEQTLWNLHAAASHPDVSDEFLLFNDDFFVMEPIVAMPVLHRGVFEPLPNRKGQTSYTQQMDVMARWLRDRGYDPVLSYELHAPMAMDKSKVLETFELDAPPQAFAIHKRTLYGNHHRIGGTLMHDCKIRSDDERLDRPFLSTNDAGFQRRKVGTYIRAAFPEPSEYEEAA